MISLIVDLMFASAIAYCAFYLFCGISDLYNNHI